MSFLGLDPEEVKEEGKKQFHDFMDKALPILRDIIKSPQALGLLAIFLSAFIRSTRKPPVFFPTPSQGPGTGVWKTDFGLDVVIIDVFPFEGELTTTGTPTEAIPVLGPILGLLKFIFGQVLQTTTGTTGLPRELGELRLSEVLFYAGMAMTVGPAIKETIQSLIPG